MVAAVMLEKPDSDEAEAAVQAALQAYRARSASACLLAWLPCDALEPLALSTDLLFRVVLFSLR